MVSRVRPEGPVLDPEICERARRSRDPRFDGRFFIGVVTTGVYCRPICPAAPAKAANVRFFPTAAAAQAAGFRPCLRCRPEAAPGTSAWRGTGATISRGLRLIAEGRLDDGSVEELAARLGVGSRHLRRLFLRHLGATPSAVAKTRRLHFAKQLLDETDLSMADVAFAAGFGSVRRFNATIREVFERTPSELRRRRRRRSGERELGGGKARDEGLTLHLRYRPPLDWRRLLGFLAPRATPGVEAVEGEEYRRTGRIGDHRFRVRVRALTEQHCLELRISPSDPRHLLQVVERARVLFDLDADPEVIDQRLAAAAGYADRLRHPGLRVPGAWDGFELGVRAILGQQVTVRGATTLAGRLARRFGEPLGPPAADGLDRLFPTPEELAEGDLAAIGLPRARAAAIRGLARAVLDGDISFSSGLPLDAFIERFTRLPGIGDWTAQYVAMRALHEPDAFPAGDLGLRRALAHGSRLPSPRQVLVTAEPWRPFRAYAAMAIWQGQPL